MKFSSKIIVLFLLAIFTTSTDGKFCHDPNTNVSLNCDGIFNVVHKCTAEFVGSAMNHSDPFTVCTSLYTFTAYQIMIQYFHQLFNTYDTHNISALCSDKLLNKNRMNLITNLVATSSKIWADANCDFCYNDSSVNDQNFTQNTLDFNESHDELYKCIDDTQHETASPVCEKCMKDYQKLNGLYEKIKHDDGGHICFDLEDKMNKTRQEWSAKYKCCRDRRDSLTAFYSLFTAIFVIAGVFYASVYCVGIRNPTSETLDEREVSRNLFSGGDRPGPSSVPVEVRRIKEMNINGDDSDDEILDGSSPQIRNSNLITLGSQ